MNLPELPEGHRWRLTKTIWVKGHPILRLEKKVWWGWKKIDENFTALSVWGNVDKAVEWAAGEILKRQAVPFSEIPYGVLDSGPTP